MCVKGWRGWKILYKRDPEASGGEVCVCEREREREQAGESSGRKPGASGGKALLKDSLWSRAAQLSVAMETDLGAGESRG